MRFSIIGKTRERECHGLLFEEAWSPSYEAPRFVCQRRLDPRKGHSRAIRIGIRLGEESLEFCSAGRSSLCALEVSTFSENGTLHSILMESNEMFFSISSPAI
jgi:hypothetical protein